MSIPPSPPPGLDLTKCIPIRVAVSCRSPCTFTYHEVMSVPPLPAMRRTHRLYTYISNVLGFYVSEGWPSSLAHGVRMHIPGTVCMINRTAPSLLKKRISYVLCISIFVC